MAVRRSARLGAFIVLAACMLSVAGLLQGLPTAVAGRVDDYDPDEFDNIDAVEAVDTATDVGDMEEDHAVDSQATTEAPAAAPAVEADEKLTLDGESDKVEAAIAAQAGPKSYRLEAVAIGGLVVFAIVFVWGRGVNESIATAFEKTFAELFQEQFAEVLGADPGRLLSKTSQNSFKLFATGRRGCRGMMCELELKRRQNLLDMLMGVVSKAQEDLVTITFPKDTMEPFVLAVMHKKAIRAVNKATTSLKAIARSTCRDKLPEKFEAVTDCPEMAKKLLTPSVVTALSNEKYFRVMHIADEIGVADTSLRLADNEIRFQFRLPSAGKMGELMELMKMALFMVDRVTSTPMSADARRLSKKLRVARRKAKAVETRADRLAAQKRQQEARQAAQEAEYEKLTPAQKAKWDAKMEAKRAKKRRPRMRMKAM